MLDRAFSPRYLVAGLTQAVGLGWDNGAPLALEVCAILKVARLLPGPHQSGREEPQEGSILGFKNPAQRQFQKKQFPGLQRIRAGLRIWV